MYCHSNGYGNEYHSHPPLFCNKDCTVEQRYPHHCHRDSLHTQWQCLMLPEVPYVGPQMLVRHQPVIQPLRTAHIHCSRQQKERCCWQHRQANAHNAQYKRHCAQKCKKVLHCYRLLREDTKKYRRGYNGQQCKYFFKKTFFYIFFRTLHP